MTALEDTKNQGKGLFIILLVSSNGYWPILLQIGNDGVCYPLRDPPSNTFFQATSGIFRERYDISHVSFIHSPAGQ